MIENGPPLLLTTWKDLLPTISTRITRPAGDFLKEPDSSNGKNKEQGNSGMTVLSNRYSEWELSCILNRVRISKQRATPDMLTPIRLTTYETTSYVPIPSAFNQIEPAPRIRPKSYQLYSSTTKKWPQNHREAGSDFPTLTLYSPASVKLKVDIREPSESFWAPVLVG